MQAYELVEILSEEEAYLLGYIVQKAVQKLNADGFGERNKL